MYVCDIEAKNTYVHILYIYVRSHMQYCSTYNETNSSYVKILVEVIGNYMHVYSTARGI